MAARSAAEVRVAEADRTDAICRGTRPVERGAVARLTRARRAGADTAVVAVLHARDLLLVDRSDIRVRRLGHEARAVILCVDQFLTHLCASLFRGRCAIDDAKRREGDQ